MRYLILLRGMPGIGKSTWIQKHGLEGFTLSADTVRTLYAGPIREPAYGNWDISQKYNKQVFNFIHDRLRDRMRKGETVFMDEQNIDISEYMKMASDYSYTVVVVQFPMDKNTAIERNTRRLPVYKRVPEEVIHRSFTRMSSTHLPSQVKVYTPDAFEVEFLRNSQDIVELADQDWTEKYPDGVVVFGDLHGCLKPLQDYFEVNLFSTKKLYIFLGDYLDRGTQNGLLLEFLMQLPKENCIFLEGNHLWERYYAKNLMDEVKSDEFIQYTIPQIAHIQKADILAFCDSWKLFAAFKYGPVSYFCSHAGFGYVPDNLFLMSAHDFIKGHRYSDDVDAWYNAAAERWTPVQLHGHRNQYHYDMNRFADSINLCSPIEFGGPLRVVELYADGTRKLKEIPNTMSNLRQSTKESPIDSAPPLRMSERMLIDLRRHTGDIREKVLPQNVSSFNFSRDVFYSGKWDELSQIARALFVNSTSGSVVARGWKKFFNWGEEPCTEEHLKKVLKFPVDVYQKYNGYLGLLSWHNFDLFFASKSTTEGPYADNFERLFKKLIPAETQREIYSFLSQNGCTMLFEVIDPVNDPHIVEYDEPELVLLDLIDNSYAEETLSYETLQKVANKFNLKCKLRHVSFQNWHELEQMYKRIQNPNSALVVEGFVCEDSNHFRFKMKTYFYTFWKHMRSLKDRIAKGKQISTQNLSDEGKAVVQFMESNYRPEILDSMSIIQVRNDYNKFIEGEQNAE